MRILLDTNILISALIFGGKPRHILTSILSGQIVGVTSSVLIAEFFDVVNKKFSLSLEEILLVRNQIENKFIKVEPKKSLTILKDEDDNRVLEAVDEGGCDYIITADKELLTLKSFKNIKILKPEEFIETNE